MPAPRADQLQRWIELATLSLLCMEAAWVTNWYNLILPAPPWELAFATLLGVLLLSHLLARLLLSRGWKMAYRRLAYALWLILIALASARLLVFYGRPIRLPALLASPLVLFSSAVPDMREFWHFFIVLLLVWRGASLARYFITPANTLRSLQMGLLMLFFFGLVNLRFDPQRNLPLLYIFLFFGLCANAAARIGILSQMRGGRIAPLSRRWLLTIAISVLAVVGAGLLLGQLSGSTLLPLFHAAAMLLLAAAALLALVITIPVLMGLLYVAPLLGRLLRNTPLLDFFQQSSQLSLQTAEERAHQISTAIQSTRPVLCVSVLLILLVITLIAIQRRRDGRRWQAEEETASLPTALPIPRIGALRLPWLAALQNARRQMAAARIRRIYAALMQLCAKLDLPRPPARTPLEFLPTMQKRFPQQAAGLALITRAYLQVRYGELPEDENEMQNIQRAWEEIRRAGNQQLHARS